MTLNWHVQRNQLWEITSLMREAERKGEGGEGERMCVLSDVCCNGFIRNHVRNHTTKVRGHTFLTHRLDNTLNAFCNEQEMHQA